MPDFVFNYRLMTNSIRENHVFDDKTVGSIARASETFLLNMSELTVKESEVVTFLAPFI